MRWLLLALVVLAPASAYADDVAVGGAVGAGGQGAAGYSALELRLDAEWRGARIGLGGRAVWEGGALRTREWSRPVDAIALLRQLELAIGPVALAAGALSPSLIGHVADGYRAALDDRPRTGARVSLTTAVEGVLEIDDVLDPALVGGGLAYEIVPAWGLRAASAVDPATARVAIEVGGARRWERTDSRVELGASLVGETAGLGAVGFASAALDRAGARWTIGGDLRAGTGTNGAAFGPLYRVERSERAGAGVLLDDASSGIGGGLHASVASERGWLALGGRYRPGLGPLGTITAGAPMSERWQAAAWLATSPNATAGAAELRAVWATHLHTSLQLARMYVEDAMGLAPAWSATVWFGASTR